MGKIAKASGVELIQFAILYSLAVGKLTYALFSQDLADVISCTLPAALVTYVTLQVIAGDMHLVAVRVKARGGVK